MAHCNLLRISNGIRPYFGGLVVLTTCLGACGGKDSSGDGPGDTENVGAFDGLFDGVAVGFNFPLDIGIAPDDPLTEDEVEGGDVFVASYGTSEVMHVPDPSGESGADAESFFDGTSEGLSGATAISVPDHQTIWATFEQGGENGNGGIAVLDATGSLLTLLDSSVNTEAFANPGGICYGGATEDPDPVVHRFFMVNMGDGSAWRIDAPATDGANAEFTLVGTGLATGVVGNPGSPGNGLTSSGDLPQGGARGCAYHAGSLYVADAQNARIVRFDDADTGSDLTGAALEDTPNELVTYPTDVAVNDDGYLIVISYDNAHAFVALETPGGGFLDNGLHDLNVNSGNYGVAVAANSIWFTRANNQNGSLRAVTPSQGEPPSTTGPFPPQ